MANPRVPGEEHLAIDTRRSVSAATPVTPPQASIAPRHWPAPAAEHRDRATTPEASSPRPRDRGRDRTVRQLDPRADGQPGWLDSERRQRPPSYRGTPATLPPLPANRRTPPAVVATEGVRAGQTHSTERSEPARRYVSSRRPCPVPPTPHIKPNGGPKAPPATLDPPRVATRAHGYLVVSLARSRPRPSAKQEAGGSRPGGAMTGAAHTRRGPVAR
jgi:hypothetical protein